LPIRDWRLRHHARPRGAGYRPQYDLEKGIADYLATLKLLKPRRNFSLQCGPDIRSVMGLSGMDNRASCQHEIGHATDTRTPRLSLAERDRRWAAVRKEMAARGLDAIVLWGWPVMWDFYTANARYLAPIGGNAEYNVLVFPADGDPTSIVQLPTSSTAGAPRRTGSATYGRAPRRGQIPWPTA